MNDLQGMTVGALRIMPNTAKEVATFAKGIIQSVKDGNSSALEVLVMMRALQLLSKEIIEEIEENVLNEANRFRRRPSKDMAQRLISAMLKLNTCTKPLAIHNGKN